MYLIPQCRRRCGHTITQHLYRSEWLQRQLYVYHSVVNWFVLDATLITHLRRLSACTAHGIRPADGPVTVEDPYLSMATVQMTSSRYFWISMEKRGTSYQPPVLAPGTYIYRVRVIDLAVGNWLPKRFHCLCPPEATIQLLQPTVANGSATVTQTGPNRWYLFIDRRPGDRSEYGYHRPGRKYARHVYGNL